MARPKKKTTKPSGGIWPWVVVLIAVVFVAVIRIRLLQIPLERDEGEFAYMGQLMLQGHAPYSLAYNMKLPGIYAAYALIMAVFGQTVGGIHFGFLLVNAAAIVMVFLLGKRLFDPLAGAVAGVAYAVLTIHPGIFSTSAHATHFVVLFALGGLIVLLRALDSGRIGGLAVSGLLFGIAFLMKQPGAFFVLFGAAYILWSDIRVSSIPARRSLGRTGLFLLSAALPYGLTCFAMWMAGIFPRFWFWTHTYALAYGSVNGLREIIGEMGLQYQAVIAPMGLVWILGLLGFTVFIWDRNSRKRLWFAVAFFGFSTAASCTGLRFVGHHLVLLLPALALQAGLCVSAFTRLLAGRPGGSMLRLIPSLVFLICIGLPVNKQMDLFFRMTPEKVSRTLYAWNPFPEATEIGKVLKSETKPSDTIGVLGSEPEIFFYAQRRSATGYIYMYSLTEAQPYVDAMRNEMIDEITRARPKFLVIVAHSCSWVCTSRRDDAELVRWVQDFIKVGYKPAGRVWMDPYDPDKRVYSWKRPTAVGAPVVDILKRID